MTDCEGHITGECDCTVRKPNQESHYNGKGCECCNSGKCQTNCFNRYSPESRGENEMCSGNGECSCDSSIGDAKQKVGEKCKVLIILMFSSLLVIRIIKERGHG